MGISNLGQIKRLGFKPQANQVQTKRTEKPNSMDTSIFGVRQTQPVASASSAYKASAVFQSAKPQTENKSNNKEISYADIDFENLNNLTKSELDTIEGQLQEDISNPNISTSLQNSLKTKLKKVKEAQKNLATGQTDKNDETEEAKSKENKETKTNKRNENSPIDKMANSVGAGNSKLSTGVGLVAAIRATAVTNETGTKTNKATELMMSEQSRMDGQKADNDIKNKEFEEQLEKLQQQQKKDIKLQQAEEKKIQEEQKKIEETNAQVETISQEGSSFINCAKDENDANDKQNEMNTRIEAKTKSMQSQNTKIGTSQRKVNQFVRKQKNNTKTSANLANRQAITNQRYKTSVNTAAARVVSANTAAGTAKKTSMTAAEIGQMTTMAGEAAIVAGQALKATLLGAGAGEALEKYGRITKAAGIVTTTTAGIVDGASGKTSAAAGVATASTTGAHTSNIKLGNIQRRTMTNTTSFSKQVTSSTKSAKQVNKTTQTLKSQVQQTVSNVRNEINAQTLEKIADVQTKQTNPLNNKQNPMGKSQQFKSSKGNFGTSVGMAGAMMSNRSETDNNVQQREQQDDPMKKRKLV